MMRLGIIVILAGTLFLAGAFVSQSVVAQDFPYSVPQAPEFDNRGNHVEADSTEEPDAGHRRRSRPYPRVNENELRYGDVKPYTSQDAPPAPSRRRAPRVSRLCPPTLWAPSYGIHPSSSPATSNAGTA